MPGRKHILVVEDEPHLAFGIKFNLERKGYRVTCAGDGPAALKIVEDSSDPVDLAILDIMLPGMSGYAVCEAIRVNSATVTRRFSVVVCVTGKLAVMRS